MNKRKLVLEVHHFAPELNQAILLVGRKGNWRAVKHYSIPGIFTIRDARRHLFPVYTPVIHAVVKAENELLPSLNRTYRGTVVSRKDAISFARSVADKHRGGPLLDGTVLPDAKIKLSVKQLYVKKNYGRERPQ